MLRLHCVLNKHFSPFKHKIVDLALKLFNIPLMEWTGVKWPITLIRRWKTQRFTCFYETVSITTPFFCSKGAYDSCNSMHLVGTACWRRSLKRRHTCRSYQELRESVRIYTKLGISFEYFHINLVRSIHAPLSTAWNANTACIFKRTITHSWWDAARNCN